jgi:hypothetical protein
MNSKAKSRLLKYISSLKFNSEILRKLKEEYSKLTDVRRENEIRHETFMIFETIEDVSKCATKMIVGLRKEIDETNARHSMLYGDNTNARFLETTVNAIETKILELVLSCEKIRFELILLSHSNSVSQGREGLSNDSTVFSTITATNRTVS